MKSMFQSRWLAPVAAAGVLGLVLAGCSGSTGVDRANIDCTPYDQYGAFQGDTVEIYATIVDVEADQLLESWADFEACTGIAIDYVGTQEAETQINVRAAAGDAPELMIIPQPGLLQRLIADGYVVPGAPEVEANVDSFWSKSWKTYGSVDGTFYAAPLMASVKGWIWYSPATFAANGYDVPTTWNEMMALTERMTANNSATSKPWCEGFGSGDATGWPGTDWIEDVVLRDAGPQAYDAWVAGELPFSSPEVTVAFTKVGDILLNPDYVNGGYGGVNSIVSTTFNDGGLPILDGNCAMFHQASFYEAQWPEGTTVAPDGDIWAFSLPSETADGGRSVVGGGEFVAAFDDSAATVAVQRYLSSAEWANTRVAIGGVISANTGLDPTLASSQIGQASIELLQADDTTFRFDGSDLMPAAVGTSSFWTGMVDWVVGTRSTSEVTRSIDSTYP